MTTTRYLRRSTRRLLPVLGVVLLAGVSACEKRATGTPGQWVTILHTNDIHGKYRATPASWVDGNPLVGGFPAAGYYIDRERKEAGRSLLLDAGDFMTGNPICELEYRGVRGGGMVEFLNLMGYDAICLGNHDFDNKWEATRKLVGLAAMPVLCVNLFEPSGEYFSGKGYEIYDLDGVRVGVIGLIMDNLSDYLRAGALGPLRLEPGLSSIERVLDEVDRRTDLIIVLTHIGVESDEELASHLSGRVDVIVGGHSHTVLQEPMKRSGVLIVQAGSNNRSLGRLDVFVQGDSVSDYRGRLISMWASKAKPRPEVEALARRFDAQIDSLYGEVIAELTADMATSSRGESSAGSWIADRLREVAGTDIAVINSGGIRKHLPKGPVKVLDIREMLPFDNELMVFECSGDELLTMIRRNAQGVADGGGTGLQISGLRYAWRPGPTGAVVIEKAEVGGRPLERTRTYRVASPDYSVTHSDHAFGFEPHKVRSLNVTVTQVVTDAVRKARVIHPETDGRMEEIKAK